MSDIPKLDLKSKDIVADKQQRLKELFPEIFTEEDKIDFDKLRLTLGDSVDTNDERFGLHWAGKKECFSIIQEPSIGTLKPAKDESVNWDDTENLFIEGDNLEVLKLLQKSYYGKVKMIYIDPPYNTGKEFIYPDKYQENLDTYLAYSGQINDDGYKFSTNAETEGRFHSNWLNMMYPRLFLARNLLKDDGVIIVHIDENEATNLKLVLDEIFGYENDLGIITWDKKNPKGDATKIAVQNETILVYTKNFEELKKIQLLKRQKPNAEKILRKAQRLFKKLGKKSVPSEITKLNEEFSLNLNLKDFEKEYSLEDVNEEFKQWLKKQDVSGGEAAYSNIDNDGQVYQSVSMAWPNKKKAPDDYFIPLIHPITKKECSIPEKGWRNPPDTMKELLDKDEIIFGEDENTQPRRKYVLKKNMEENIPSILPFGGSDDKLFKKMGIPFENPKPIKFAKSLLNYFLTGQNEIIIDFFAGSGTAAHACIENNYDNKSKHKFILVQLPEKLKEKSEAYKKGFRNEAELAKSRIKYVSKEFLTEKQTIETELQAKETALAKLEAQKAKTPELFKNGKSKDLQKLEANIKELKTKIANIESTDLGFKVFKLDKSNFKVWDGSVENDVSKQIEMAINHLEPDSKEFDILFEILLKAGFELTLPIKELTLADKKVYSVEDDALLICLENELNEDVIRAIAVKEPARFVCLDTGFKDNDQLKTNAVQIMKSHNVHDFKTV
jgi:adenine-specific DNA-methyltransferase